MGGRHSSSTAGAAEGHAALSCSWCERKRAEDIVREDEEDREEEVEWVR